MIKYVSFIDEEKGLCAVGTGEDIQTYIEMGMTEMDVEQSDVDNCWYTKEKCPHKTEKQKDEELIQKRILEIKNELNEIDLKSIRSLRAGETEYLQKYENQVQQLRQELQQLEGELNDFTI